MSIERVRDYFRQWDMDSQIMEFEQSSATVELAAVAVGVEPARIAKSLSFKADDGALLIIAAGDAKVDNAKFKAQFGFKARMLTVEQALEYTGHAVGGVCPFALPNDVEVFLDVSLQRFETVFPACGSSNSAIKLTCAELEKYSRAKNWVDVCKAWREEGF